MVTVDQATWAKRILGLMREMMEVEKTEEQLLASQLLNVAYGLLTVPALSEIEDDDIAVSISELSSELPKLLSELDEAIEAAKEEAYDRRETNNHVR
jgi:hypothetical protein